jgi:hypothetical protein
MTDDRPTCIDIVTPAAHQAVVDLVSGTTEAAFLAYIVDCAEDTAQGDEPKGWYFESRIRTRVQDNLFWIHRGGYPQGHPSYLPGYPPRWTLMLPEESLTILSLRSDRCS